MVMEVQFPEFRLKVPASTLELPQIVAVMALPDWLAAAFDSISKRLIPDGYLTIIVKNIKKAQKIKPVKDFADENKRLR
jgi:hypothetical protein